MTIKTLASERAELLVAAANEPAETFSFKRAEFVLESAETLALAHDPTECSR